MNTENLIEKVLSTGASLEVNGGKLVVKKKDGPLADHLIDELRQNKAEVISTLKKGQTGQHFEAGECSEIIPGEERYLRKFVGDRVSFLLTGSVEGCLATPGTKFAEGTILSQTWLGNTKIWNIPEYLLRIRTDDGQEHTRRLVEHYIAAVK